ncbi:MAG: histidinol dehydrogenase, partial [Thiomonas sp.]|nr:histidinol dehydrogenase [Thiomonas sp.]
MNAPLVVPSISPFNALQLRRLDATGADFETQYRALFSRMAEENAEIDLRAAEILRDVQQRGDAAVLDCTRKFDRLDAPSMAALDISQAELQAALA